MWSDSGNWKNLEGRVQEWEVIFMNTCEKD